MQRPSRPVHHPTLMRLLMNMIQDDRLMIRGVTIHRYMIDISIQCMMIRCIDATRKISIFVKRHFYFATVHIFI